jgi:PKHD-type hydroxylase
MDGTEIIQSVGDGALYQGCDVYHWRKPFKGEEYIQVFLHYVDANGPYKDHVYDSGDKGVLGEPELRFTFTGTNAGNHRWYSYSQGFTEQECDTIVKMFKGQELQKAVVGNAGQSTLDETHRRSLVFWIPKVKRNSWIYERILNLVGQANENIFKFDICELIEPLQFTQYDSTFQGKYDWHVDSGGHDIQGNRKLSVVVQLSYPTEYEGGQLQFGVDDKLEDADKTKGTFLIFPSYMRHRVTEVTKGVRYSLVTWISGPPFR